MKHPLKPHEPRAPRAARHTGQAPHRLLAERDASLADLGRGMIHQLRNQLCVVSGGLHLGLERADGSLRDALRLAEEGARRMVRTLDDLLTLTQAPPLRFETVEPWPFLSRFLDGQEPGLARRGITLERRFAGGPRGLPADAALLAEALSAVVQNAVEAMPAGGRILFETCWTPRDPYLQIRLTDSGPGLSPVELHRAFQPYYTTKMDAVGMGLTVARRILELHAGSIQLECPASGGTVATLCLPIAH